ncbi:MAG TPA: hypothetical protein VLQ46_01735, partial [Casimicrobiaceae bacterium]|nr:hypothetical protein [Casimicrobiaceae bacterium]
RPICLPYILGKKGNPSYVVGGSFDIAAPNCEKGYVLRTLGFVDADRLMLLAEIRLFANLHTPTYHVVVGDIRQAENIRTVLDKVGPITVTEMESEPSYGIQSEDHHWMPRVWPLPFWATEPVQAGGM